MPQTSAARATKCASSGTAFSAVGDQILELGDFAVDRVENYLQHGYVRNVLRPYQLVMALGVALLVLSLLGCLGSLCPSRQVGREMLFGYFSVVLVFVCVLWLIFVWVECPCFLGPIPSCALAHHSSVR